MTTYFGILTKVGEAKEANAKALGVPVKIAEMEVGDGGGALPVPDREQTSLIGSKHRAPINRIFVDPSNPAWLVVEQVIPEQFGGWWARELGLRDADGDLIAVSNCPPTYKPQMAEGSARTQVVRMVLQVSSTSNFTLKIDPSVVLATRQYVDEGLSRLDMGNVKSGILPVIFGGTGKAALSKNYFLLGNDTDPIRAISPDAALKIMQAAPETALERSVSALPWPHIEAPGGRIAVSGEAASGKGGRIVVSGGELIQLARRTRGGLAGISVVSTIPAWQSPVLDAARTYYLRAKLSADAEPLLYVQQGSDSDMAPPELVGQENAGSGGGFDSTVFDALLAKVTTGSPSTTPTVLLLANRAKLQAEFSFAGIYSEGITTQTYTLNWARIPRAALQKAINAELGTSYESIVQWNPSLSRLQVSIRAVGYKWSGNEGGTITCAYTALIQSD